MRRMFVTAIAAVALMAALETVAAALGWAPGTWVAAVLPAAAGIAAFLAAGRLRVLRRRARQKARARTTSSGTGYVQGRMHMAHDGHVTVVSHRRAPGGGCQAELAPIRADEDTLSPP
jgi:hypothetical protein